MAVALVAVAALALALVIGRSGRVPPGEANPWPSTDGPSLPAELPGVYVVQPGDTLWDLARSLAPDEDPRAVVHELAEAAGGVALEPGQQIVIGAVSAVPAGADPTQRTGQAEAAPGSPPAAT